MDYVKTLEELVRKAPPAVGMTREQIEAMLIDHRCRELAERFLNSDATSAMKAELAEWIQWRVELWLCDDKEGAKEAAETLGDPDRVLQEAST